MDGLAGLLRRSAALAVPAFLALASTWAGPVGAQDEPWVATVRIDGPITAVTADYLDRALDRAESDGAEALLVELDTPGGDTTSMGRMTEALLNARVPTIVWVGPEGARAASAGTFLVLAAHAAGMAPRTVIGAASPVASGGEELPETLGRKAIEDMAAQARALGARRSPEAADWAERAVRDAVSATASEALEIGIIDGIAADVSEMLDEVDGLRVEVLGEPVRLRTADAATEPIEMTASESLLSRLAHPAIALLLLTIGVNAILIELSNPGGYVAGILGALALALGFYSLGVLEANWIGLGFVAAAFALFLLEIKSPSFGLLTAGGIGAFVVGSVILFSGGAYAVPWGMIIVLALGSAAFFAFVVAAAVRTMRRQPTTGGEALIGARARVVAEAAPAGKVALLGEVWDAVSEDGAAIPTGTIVSVVGRDGFTLRVRPDPSGRP